MARGDGDPLASWRDALILNEKGNPQIILANLMTVLRLEPSLNKSLGFDKLQSSTMATGPLPWDQGITEPREWRDNDDRFLAEWFQNQFINTGINLVIDAVQAVSFENAYHPVLDYLESLSWDGVDRLDTWAIDYLGVNNTEYTRSVSSKWMISAIARIYSPGCKADCALVLEGEQGIGKSTALRYLGQPWYTDEIAALGTKDASEQIIGVWIVELAELDAATRAADIAHVKAFMSRQTDRFRFSYGRRVMKYPRQCVFAATSNSSSWNRDETGGRRWWPLTCGNIRADALHEARDQLWAEARDRFLSGECWHLDNPAVTAEAVEIVEERYPEDPWADKISKALESLSDRSRRDVDGEYRTWTTTSEIMAELNLLVERQDRGAAMRVAVILRRHGWEKRQVRPDPANRKHREYRYYKLT